MSDFLHALRVGPLLSDGANGSYLFSRTGRLSEANHAYEALNVSDPDAVRQLHFAYLQAGARCLTTNTFGANRAQLRALGETGRVEELNHAGVMRAREAISTFREQTGDRGPHFVLGSIGPAREEQRTADQIRETYDAQVRALVDAGVDALQVETFSDLQQVEGVLRLIGELADPPPVIVQMALHELADGRWNLSPSAFLETAVALGAAVVGANCCAPWEASAFVDRVAQLDAVAQGRVLISAMPNAGGFQRIDHRYMTAVNPEFMGKLARTLTGRGVRLIGGCCEVHPEHISEMHNYLHSRPSESRRPHVLGRETLAPAGREQKRDNGRFSRKLLDGEFAVSVEMLPSRGTAPKVLEQKTRFVAELSESGKADAVDITDGSRGIPLVPPGDFITCLRERLGWNAESGDALELIPHFTTRDLNAMGLQSRLMGYHFQRIHNLIAITGDPPKMSPSYPRSTAVFDLDSVGLVGLVHRCLNSGVDFGGQRLGRQADPRTHFTVGTGFEPEALDVEREVERLVRKIDCGADYVMTQPAFRHAPLAALEPYRARVPILVGVMILTGLAHAQRVGQVPGVTIPQATYDRLAKFASADDQAKAGRDIAVEQVRWIREQGWSGLYLMSPASNLPVLDVLESL